jgi:DnaJ-class molecular chaperone
LAEINAAYDVVGNPEKRQQYDLQQSAGGDGGQFHWRSAHGGFSGNPFSEFEDILNEFHRQQARHRARVYSISLTLEQAYNGCTIDLGDEHVQVPRGVRTGNILHLHNKNIRITVEQHRKFKRSNDDLLVDINITAFEAMTGITVNLTHISGKKYSVKIPAGTQPGQVVKMSNLGMPNPEYDICGDLLIRCNITVPTELTDEEKQFIVSRTRGSLDV